MDFVNNNCNSMAGTTRIAVKPRQSLPAETEVQAGIEVQSPKRVGPDSYRGAGRTTRSAWQALERLPAETEVQAE